MSIFKIPREEFKSIASNYDTVWVKYFGYQRSEHDAIHTIDNDIKSLSFSAGFNSSYPVSAKQSKHIMYRTLDDVSIHISENSSFIVFSDDSPCQVRMLRFEGGKGKLYKFNVNANKYEQCEENLREWKLIRHWYKETACPKEVKEARFMRLNHHGLQYAKPSFRHLPSILLEDKEIVAMNYVTRIHCDSLIRVNHWVKFVVISPISLLLYKYTYFKEHETRRTAIINRLDPDKMHLAEIPRGLLFNTVGATWLSGLAMALFYL